jgi:hypothetical protein
MNGLTSRQNVAVVSGPDKLTLLAYTFVVLFAGTNFVAVRFTVAELPPFCGGCAHILGDRFFTKESFSRSPHTAWNPSVWLSEHWRKLCVSLLGTAEHSRWFDISLHRARAFDDPLFGILSWH